jgi:hypothetical protein
MTERRRWVPRLKKTLPPGGVDRSLVDPVPRRQDLALKMIDVRRAWEEYAESDFDSPEEGRAVTKLYLALAAAFQSSVGLNALLNAPRK